MRQSAQRGNALAAAARRERVEEKLRQAEQSQRILAEAGKVLAASLDYSTRLANVARLVVPRLADWCIADVVEDDGSLRRIAVVHEDPAKVKRALELQHSYLPDPNAPRGTPNVLRTGQAEIYADIPDSLIEAAAPDAESLALLRALGLKSAMVVPLMARGRALGALTFVWAESGRRYGPADLTLAEELASRTALAVDNARLYAEAQRLNAELEQRVLRRTAELLNINAKLQDEIRERERVQSRLERSQDLLRRLSAHLQAVREEERTRIAREIHDELGQALTSLKMDLARLQKGLGVKQTFLLKNTQAMSDLIDTTIQTVRRISTELRPGVLDDLGLVAAIEWQLQEFQTRTGIVCRLVSNVDEIDLDPDRSTAAFRVFQETLTNVARHANATQVEVTLEDGGGSLMLQVQDNGRGITESELTNGKSLGLIGMQERVHLLAGGIQISGSPGKGTTVQVRIPHADSAPK